MDKQDYSLRLYVIAMMLLAIFIMVYSIKQDIKKIEKSAFLIGCADSGKVSRAQCLEEWHSREQ
jgi:hypothetical protein